MKISDPFHPPGLFPFDVDVGASAFQVRDADFWHVWRAVGSCVWGGVDCIVLFGASAPVGCIEEGWVCLIHVVSGECEEQVRVGLVRTDLGILYSNGSRVLGSCL
jgi:hypothetical protein